VFYSKVLHREFCLVSLIFLYICHVTYDLTLLPFFSHWLVSVHRFITSSCSNENVGIKDRGAGGGKLLWRRAEVGIFQKVGEVDSLYRRECCGLC
jgi:hypothetical protein